MLKLEIPSEKFKDFHFKMNKQRVNYRVLKEKTDIVTIKLDSQEELEKAQQILASL